MYQPSLEILNKKRIILADDSPDIEALLKNVGLRVTICSATAKENLKPDDFWSISEFLETSAHQKVSDVEELFSSYGFPPDIVIGCESYVKVDGILYNKTKEEDNVFKTLKMISGKSYIVSAGIVIKMGDNVVKFTENTKVYVRDLSDNDIRTYVATGEPFTRSTNCGIYGVSSCLIDKIEGDFFTVIGFPLLRLGKEMEILAS